MSAHADGWIGPSVASFDDVRLASKLAIPESRDGLVSRRSLVDHARSTECRVVAVSAPAGYGKTSLLAEWATIEDRRVAWASLDRFDDDPAILLAVIANAYIRTAPEHSDMANAIASLGLSALGRGAPALGSVLRAATDPFVLMLDDVHELRSTDCHDVLGVVINSIPPGSQVVTASRTEPPHLARHRATGDTLELTGPDLALDSEGARHIFARARIELTSDAAATVTARTEGWPVGLYLASLIASDGGGDPTAIAGDDRFIADYLYHESLRHLTDRDQQFLRRTAVLDQLTPSLCDAVLLEPGSDDRLRRLEGVNSFLVPVDRRRRWYRYHGLFREFLLAELHRVEPGVASVLHLRAADWFESNGSRSMAIEHLLRTGERERTVRLVTAMVSPTFESGQITTIQRWLSALGDDAIEAHPPLAVMASWISMFAGLGADAQRWANVAESASFEQAPGDGSASYESARAMLRAMMCASGPEQMLADATLAVTLEPPWSQWRETAVALEAEARLLIGDLDGAMASLTSVTTAAGSSPNADPRLVAWAEMSLLAIERGDWKAASDLCGVAIDRIEKRRMHEYPTALLAFATAARIAAHDGDVDGAQRYLLLAMRARPSLTVAMPFVAVRVRLQLAKAHLALADAASARQLLREIDDVLTQRPRLGTLVDEVAHLRDVVSSSVEAVDTGTPPLTPAELRLLPFLQTHLTIREIAERLFVSRNTINSEMSSIYRKLGVSSRGQAVERATTIGLLGV